MLCSLTTKGKEIKSQLSLKGTWRETRKQRPEAKAMPKGMRPEVHGQAGARKSVKRISGG